MLHTFSFRLGAIKQMAILLPCLLFIAINSFGQGSVSATYSSGDIPTSYFSFDATCNGPTTTLSVSLPAGDSYTVTGIDIAS